MCRVATCIAERAHFVVECVPVSGEHVAARDDDVDLAGAVGDAGSHLRDPRGER